MLLTDFQRQAGLPNQPSDNISAYLAAKILLLSIDLEGASLLNQIEFVRPILSNCAQLANSLGVPLNPPPSHLTDIQPSDLYRHAQKLAQMTSALPAQVAVLSDTQKHHLSQLLQQIVRCLASVALQSNTTLQRIITT